jgi:hypothetical protein
MAGLNFGWKVFEGNEMASDTASGCAPEALNGTHTPPVLDFEQGSMSEDVRGACSVTGGYVYRGSAIPALVGWYLYTDFCTSDVGAFRYCGGMATSPQRTDLDVGFGTSSFGEDNQGELYVVIHDDSNGRILQIVSP